MLPEPKFSTIFHKNVHLVAWAGLVWYETILLNDWHSFSQSVLNPVTGHALDPAQVTLYWLVLIPKDDLLIYTGKQLNE